jgi:dipeptidase D
LPVGWERPSAQARAIEVRARGLKGGHSGLDIHLQRGNAIRALARLLRSAGGSCRVARLEGGNAHNAIPREAWALCAVEPAELASVTRAMEAEAEAMRGELGTADPGLVVSVTPAAERIERVFDAPSRGRVVSALCALPHGVEAMSHDVPGLVETSNNLAAVHTEGDAVRVLVSVRSSIKSALLALRERVHAVVELAGGSYDDNEPYPGWKPNLNSEVLRVARAVHERELSREPELKAVHAGLECGVIGEKLPGIDMISIGPWIEAPHSPAERVNIPSVATFWKFLKALVAELS